MGTGSKIEFSPGTLFIKHPEDSDWQEFRKVEEAVFEYHTAADDTVYLRKAADDMEVTFTMPPLSIRQRIKLFGFWATVKSLFRGKQNDCS